MLQGFPQQQQLTLPPASGTQTATSLPSQSSATSAPQNLTNPTSTATPTYSVTGMAPRPLYLPNGTQQPNPQQNPATQQQMQRPQQQLTPLPLHGSTPQQSASSMQIQQTTLQSGMQYQGLQSLQQQNLGLQQQLGLSGQHPGMQGLTRAPMMAMTHPANLANADGSNGNPRPASHLQVSRHSVHFFASRIVVSYRKNICNGWSSCLEEVSRANDFRACQSMR